MYRFFRAGNGSMSLASKKQVDNQIKSSRKILKILNFKSSQVIQKNTNLLDLINS